MTEDTDRVEVTQADRKAGWDYADFGHATDSQERERWFAGYYDNQPVGHPIRDFARHRFSATPPDTTVRVPDREEIARLREALDKARAQFAFYREEHRNKAGKFAMTLGAHSPECLAASEKAATNEAFAQLCNEALLTPSAGQGGEHVG